MRPGTWGRLAAPATSEIAKRNFDPWGLFKDAVPPAILSPLVDNNVIQLIVLALTFGIVLRAIKSEQIAANKRGFQAI
ncbi:hypothetical protein NUACC26_035620 [Scytonema sp. NUACC26]